MAKTIGNPGSWVFGAIAAAGAGISDIAGKLTEGSTAAPPDLRDIGLDDIRAALRAGLDDFAAFRGDVVFAALLYPVIGIALALLAFNQNLLPLLFPVASGFAIMGPVAAVGLYEMSRRRERGEPASWFDGFAVLQSPSVVPILALALCLFALYAVWLLAAATIYAATLGPEPPVSAAAFLNDVVGTGAGWAMILIGTGVGFLFAVAALATSVVSFPLLLDRDVGLVQAVVTSATVARRNPQAVGAWGMIVAVALALGSVPLFIGLIFVVPILGHATWHLYRRAVVPGPPTG